MKILIVQLLRLGDIVLSSPVIQGLRDQYPNAEIDLLIHKQFENVVGLMPKVNQCFTFDRELVQSSLGEKDRFVFEGFDRVNRLIQRLRNRHYDQIINLTHNRLSAYIVGGVACRERIGLWINDKNQALIESAWFRHLNQDDLGNESERFHFTDIYKFSAQLERPRLGIRLYETDCGRERAEHYLSSFYSKYHIVVQALTSDPKKNWGVDKFKACIEEIHASLPDSHFTILGAPSEAAVLAAAFKNKPHCSVVICDLDYAYSIILKSDLVLTGDTSIKHIASATATPIIELSIGSSDFRRTGSYSEKALILQSQENCAPCSHGSLCHREEHFCAKKILPELVSLVAVDLLRNQSAQIKNIAEEFSDQVRIYRVDITTTGTWMAIDVSAPFSELQVAGYFNKFVAKLFIQHSSREKDVFEIFGSESQRLANLLKNAFGREPEFKKILVHLENKISSVETKITSLESNFYQYHFANIDSRRTKELVEALISLGGKAEIADQLINDGSTVFVRLRKVQLALKNMRLKSEIELKLVRSLQTNMEA